MAGGYGFAKNAAIARFSILKPTSARQKTPREYGQEYHPSASEKREQELTRRVCANAELAAQVDGMTDSQWFDYLDAQCGPGAGRFSSSKVVRHPDEDKHGLCELARQHGITPGRVYAWASRGILAGNERVYLQTTRYRGRPFSTDEWLAEFLAAVGDAVKS